MDNKECLSGSHHIPTIPLLQGGGPPETWNFQVYILESLANGNPLLGLYYFALIDCNFEAGSLKASCAALDRKHKPVPYRYPKP